MKLSFFSAALAGLIITKVTAATLPSLDYHVIQETDGYPVYSNIAPNQRRAAVAKLAVRQGAYRPLAQAEVDSYIKEQYLLRYPSLACNPSTDLL